MGGRSTLSAFGKKGEILIHSSSPRAQIFSNNNGSPPTTPIMRILSENNGRTLKVSE
jgi:hypothetical protein